MTVKIRYDVTGCFYPQRSNQVNDSEGGDGAEGKPRRDAYKLH